MSQGTVAVGTAPTSTTSNFTVAGNHTYTKLGVYTVLVLVSDDDHEIATLSNVVTVTLGTAIATVGPLYVETNDMVAKRRHHLHYIASFVDGSGAGLPANDFTVTLDWGDKEPISNAWVQQVGSLSQYNVKGKHRYHKKGKYNVVLNVNGVLSSSVVEVLDNDC